MKSLPVSRKRHPKWHDVPDEQWDDWRWQMQNAIRTTSQLAEFFAYGPQEHAQLESLEQRYKLAIPPYYFSLINVGDPLDPIGLQSLPSTLEQASTSGIELEDPLEEDKDSPVPGLTHRYPDRALLVTTHVCSMYCRFCTRKRVTMDRDGWDAPSHNDQRMVQYVRDHREIRDVIVSGGDPLSLPVARLKWFISELAGDRPPRRHPPGHSRAGHAAAAAVRRRADRPAALGRQDLDPDALQPSARDHGRRRPALAATW